MGTVKVETLNSNGIVIAENSCFYPDGQLDPHFLLNHTLTIGNFIYYFNDEGEIKGHGIIFDGVTKSRGNRFGLTEKQEKEIKEWKDHINAIFGEYGKYEYTFSPNEIGDVLSVYSFIADIAKDFTDLDSW